MAVLEWDSPLDQVHLEDLCGDQLVEDGSHQTQPTWLIAEPLPKYFQLLKPVQKVPATMLVAHALVVAAEMAEMQTALDLGKVAVVVDRLQRVLHLQNLVLVLAELSFLHPNLKLAAQLKQSHLEMVGTAWKLELEEADLLPELHLEEPAEEVLLVAQVQEMTAAADGRLEPLPAARSILAVLEVADHSQILVVRLDRGSLDTLLADWARRVSRSPVGTAQQTDRTRSQPGRLEREAQ